MKVTKPGVMILLLCTILFTSCFVSKTKTNERCSAFAKKNADMIREMAEYAVMFCRVNNKIRFTASQIDNRKIRRKMERLGDEVTVFYCCAGNMTDSTVSFESSSIFHGITTYVYDFATWPRNAPDETGSYQNNVTIRVTPRIYFQRRPFPMM
jgi:hypothetical protein